MLHIYITFEVNYNFLFSKLFYSAFFLNAGIASDIVSIATCLTLISETANVIFLSSKRRQNLLK